MASEGVAEEDSTRLWYDRCVAREREGAKVLTALQVLRNSLYPFRNASHESSADDCAKWAGICGELTHPAKVRTLSTSKVYMYNKAQIGSIDQMGIVIAYV